MSRIVPEERQIVWGIRDGELGSNLGLDFSQAGVTPSGSGLGGAESRVVGIVLFFSCQVRAPLCIQAMQREDTDLW